MAGPAVHLSVHGAVKPMVKSLRGERNFHIRTATDETAEDGEFDGVKGLAPSATLNRLGVF